MKINEKEILLKCPNCGTMFKKWNGKKYCCPKCREETKRKRSREYNREYYRKHRKKAQENYYPISPTMGRIIIDWLSRGHSIKKIADNSNRSVKEIKDYLANIKTTGKVSLYKNKQDRLPSAAGLEFLRG